MKINIDMGTMFFLIFVALSCGIVIGYVAAYDQQKTETCTIGYSYAAGDYSPKTTYCAVQDCVAYNEYAEKYNIPTRCAV